MTSKPAALERIFFVIILLAASRAAPMFSSSFDVELVDEPETDDVDDIIRSSMATPFPVVAPGQAGDEPNFFWSGSGDDPDAGMTYWITTTVFKTSVVTMTPSTPQTTPKPTTVSIRPTPPLTVPTPSVWPSEAFEPRYWIRTVLRSSADEKSASFRRSVESNLRRMFSDHLLHGNSSSGGALHVLMRNVTRRNADQVELIYALSSWNFDRKHHVMIEPYLAVGAVRIGAAGTNVTRDLCRGQDGENVLCHSVVTQAEPFVIVDEAVVAQVAETNRRYWIVGIVLSSLLVVLILLLFVYTIVRGRKRKKQQDAAVGSRPASLVDTATQSKMSRPGSAIIQAAVPPKLSKRSSTMTEEIEGDPDPWIRKARSTSKKHGRSKLRDGKTKRSSVRPQTAPDPGTGRRPSSSSLSGIASGSSSVGSSAERLEYRLSREESVQPSRGTRRLKHKDSSTGLFTFAKPGSKKKCLPSLSAEQNEPSSPETAHAPVSKPRRLVSAIIETETQEITADFSDVPDGSDNEIDLPPSRHISKTDEVTWKPGSLIPTKISTAVFGTSRKVCSAPVYLPGGSTDRSSQKRAWSSSDAIKPPVRIEANLYSVAATYQLNVYGPNSDPGATIPGRQESSDSPARNPALHVHSSSFPAWPEIGDVDPAIELIRTIKEELKKFDHQDRS